MTLKQLRKTKFKSLKKFSEAIGEKISTVCMWENHRSAPRLRALPKIAEALDVSVDEVVGAILDDEDDEGTGTTC